MAEVEEERRKKGLGKIISIGKGEAATARGVILTQKSTS